VRVKVLATGVAFADVAARKGMYPDPTAPSIPFTPGYDIVGVVDKVGAGVSSLAVGQRVAAMLPKFGGYAEFICAPENLLVPVPDGLDSGEAVSLILNYLTAHRMLHYNAQVKAEERILVHGAAGGVGTALLQLGREAGLEIYGTASQGKHALVSSLGARPIDYRREDFLERIRSLTGDGVDAVFDWLGGKIMRRSYQALRQGGRLVSYSFAGAIQEGRGVVVSSLAQLLLYKLLPDGKKAILFGGTPGLAVKENAWYRETLATLFNLLAEGKLEPVVGKRLPLAEAVRAHELMEQAAVSGKIVLICGE
jgi:NADPH:quinone reductase-like Zn-dependent oxidoreductase